jgi:4-amino-4-deoxy-L-arabinose transferase-like glycosyltransferase
MDLMNPETISPTQPVPSDVAGTAPSEARTSLLSRALLTLAVLFVVVRALPILSLPLGRDQGTYLTIGQGLLEGKQLYRDLWDIKPPGIYIVYAGIARLFGRVMWSVAVVDILLLLLISYLLFRFTKPCLGRSGAAIAVMVHASMHGEMEYFWIAQPETFQVACVLAGYLLMRHRGHWRKASCVSAGILLGYACWLKYNAVAFLPFLLFLPFLDTSGLDRELPRVSLSISWRSWLVKAALVLTGLAAAIGVVLAWIVFKGAWPAMKEAQFEVLPRYAAYAVQRRPHYLLSVFARTNYYLGVWTLWATLLGLLVAWMRRDLKRFAPVFLAALTAYAAVVMQVRFHDYYFQTCYPFFAAIWAYLVVSIYEGSRVLARNLRQRGWRLAAGLVWIVFAEAVFWPLPGEFNKLMMRYEELREWRADAQTFYSDYPRQLPFEVLPGQFAVIHYLERNGRPSDGLYLWSADCAIYYLSGYEPPTRFLSDSHMMSPWSPLSWREELIRDLRNAQPRFIVVARRDAIPVITYVNLDSENYLKIFTKLDSFITENYEPVADFDTFVVYRRNGQTSNIPQGGCGVHSRP